MEAYLPLGLQSALFVSPSAHLAVCLSMHLPASMPVYVSMCLCISLPVFPFDWPSTVSGGIESCQG